MKKVPRSLIVHLGLNESDFRRDEKDTPISDATREAMVLLAKNGYVIVRHEPLISEQLPLHQLKNFVIQAQTDKRRFDWRMVVLHEGWASEDRDVLFYNAARSCVGSNQLHGTY